MKNKLGILFVSTFMMLGTTVKGVNAEDNGDLKFKAFMDEVYFEKNEVKILDANGKNLTKMFLLKHLNNWKNNKGTYVRFGVRYIMKGKHRPFPAYDEDLDFGTITHESNLKV